MVEAEQAQRRGVEAVDRANILLGLVAELVRRPVAEARAIPPSRLAVRGALRYHSSKMALATDPRDALRSAYAALPERDNIVDLAYVLDPEPQGGESIVVFITAKEVTSLGAPTKREVERALRSALAPIFPNGAYFRWQLESEVSGDGRKDSGDWECPRSVLQD